MGARTLLGAALLAFAASPAAFAQTSADRQMSAVAGDLDLPWGDLSGLLGLFGLLGLKRDHEEDSYHPAPIE